MSYPLTRQPILAAIRAAVEPLDYVYAMWEGGAAAFDRVDEWSDIDLQLDVQDEHIEDAFAVVGAALARLSPIELKYRLPDPTAFNIPQAFYRLQDAGPFLLVDLALIPHSHSDKLLEPQIHGRAVFHFDKTGLEAASLGRVAPQAPAVKRFDPAAWETRLRQRREQMRLTFDLYQVLVLKEINRQNWMEAMAFYQGFTLRPLVEALRMKYSPAHYNFHTRYVHYELPPEAAQRLQSFFFVARPDDLAARRAEAEAWFNQTMDELQ